MADQRNQDVHYYQVPQQPSSPSKSETKTTDQKNAHNSEVLEEQSPHADFQRNGHNLFSLKSLDYLFVYISVISIYTLAVLAIIVWMTSGPALSGGRRILKTGTLYVDQFYSGLALSALLTPSAIIIRTMSHDLGLIHPFSIAYRKPVSVKDMDKIMDPGAMSIPSIARYSWWTAFVQAYLLAAGSLIVPIGTLMVTAGPYAAQTPGTGVVGMPTFTGNGISLNDQLSAFPYPSIAAVPLDWNTMPEDHFAWNAANLASSTFMSQPGNISLNDEHLGPVATGNITFETGVTYHGLVVYQWDSGCESAQDEISYRILANTSDSSMSIINFTIPAQPDPFLWWSSTLSIPWMNLLPNSTEYAGSGYDILDGQGYEPIQYGGTMYFMAAAYNNVTKRFPDDKTGLTIDNDHDIWMTRMKCTPTIEWKIGSCIWDGNNMRNFTETPGANITALSVDGLDKLSGYMVTTAYSAYLDSKQAYDTSVTSLPFVYWPDSTGRGQWQAPGLPQYKSYFGAIASGIVTATTIGYYGTVEVPTTGEPVRQIYIARMYIVAIVFVMFTAVVVVSILDIVYMKVRRSPFRKVSFVTIVAAVQNSWWRGLLRGQSYMSQAELREGPLGNQKVKYGEELHNSPLRIGLVPLVGHIEKTKAYHG